jgi:hypothetical protein
VEDSSGGSSAIGDDPGMYTARCGQIVSGRTRVATPGSGRRMSASSLRSAVRTSRKDRHYHLFVERFSRLSLPPFPVPAIDGFECSFSAPVPERKSHWQPRNQDNSVRRIITSSSLILPAAIPSAPVVGAAERPRWLRAAAGLCSSLSGCYMSLSISANFLRA